MSTPEIVITGTPLPRLHASPECLDALMGNETGGLWDAKRKRLKLLPHGTPALAAYPDSGGVWTIGWGATGPDIFEGIRWTITECRVRFEADVLAREAAVRAMLRGAQCTQKQFEAILSLTYNAGAPAISASTLLKLHRAGDYHGAALQFLRWDKDNGHVVDGLYDRRVREKAVYEGGSW
jgi:GH24 family phage-related lysozyme (muramidase)